MSKSYRRPGSRRVLLAAVAASALGITLLQAPAIADTLLGDRDPATCSAKELRELEAAGDNFADKCLLPGQELAGLRGLDTSAAEDEDVVKTDSVTLTAELPLQGDFAEEGAFGTDLAFAGKYAFVGNYRGFAVYNIKNVDKPKQVAQIVCPGSQNDISVYKHLLIVSVDSSRNNDSCDNEAQPATEKSSWEGIRIFDISKPKQPVYVAAVETDCGSHTHTIAPSHTKKAVFVYVSSYSPSADYPDCQPPHDYVSVVKVKLKKLHKAHVVAKPVLFPDGGNAGASYSSATSGCHDLTAYPKKNLMAGACMGDGILLDITKRGQPRVIDQVTDEANFMFWHSATFNNTGTKVVFTDELGGGSAPTCNPAFNPVKGADGIYDIVDRQLVFRSYYKIDRIQALTENCVAHNGSLIPVKGKDFMVQAWYQGGFSVFDFTDSANPVEIAYYDRPALSQTDLVLGGMWSAYWYNGRIYASDITRGFNVFKLDDPRTNPAIHVRMTRFNAQSQPSY